MKKELRVSSLKDYIAVDIVDEIKPGKPILSTPLYLAKGKEVRVKAFDAEEKKWYLAKLIFFGDVIKAYDCDENSPMTGMDWEVEPNDLLDEKQFKY